LVDEAKRHALAISTSSQYTTGASRFDEFCTAFSLVAWPPSQESLCYFSVFMSLHVSLPSVLKYISGIRHTWLAAGGQWPSHQWHQFALVKKGLKHSIGLKGPKLKLPVTVGLLHAIHPCLNFGLHDDRLFWAASCVATFSCLRGSEFLYSKDRLERQKLRVRDLSWLDESTDVAILRLGATKTKFWRSDISISFFKNDTLACPVSAIISYCSRSVLLLSPDSFLFTLSNGKPLTREWMVGKLKSVLATLDIDSSHAGAASWRAGGAMSAKQAGASVDQTKALGRWTSEAYLAYVLAHPSDLRSLSLAIASHGPRSAAQIVGAGGLDLRSSVDVWNHTAAISEMGRFRSP
jgi:hypothetical protein